MATDAQYLLFETVKTHTFELEAERERASEHDRVVLDQRLEAARKLLEWLSTTLEPGAALKRCG